MDDLIPIDFQDLLHEMKISLNESEAIKDFIQMRQDSTFDGFYVATATVVNDIIYLKFKIKGKPSRNYKITNQCDLDNLISIFYVRYFLYRQLINVNLHTLTHAYVNRRKQLNTVHGYTDEDGVVIAKTREAWLPSGDMVVEFKDAPMVYSIIFNDNPNMTVKVTLDTKLSSTRDRHSLVEAVSHMFRYLAQTNQNQEDLHQASFPHPLTC